jgi:hypothetical protein
VLARLFLLALVVYAVVVIVQQVRYRLRTTREEHPSVEQRLARLDELLRRELITRAEYDEARMRIIDREAGGAGNEDRRDR